MAMTKQLWSLNALSVELGIGSRTLARRLAGLAPAVEQRNGRGIGKRWRLADVFHHLNGHACTDTRDADAELLAGIKEVIGKTLFPGLLCSRFTEVFTGGMRVELKLSKAQAVRAYQIACLAIVSGLSEHLKDEDMLFHLPPHVAKFAEMGVEEYVKRYWPDANDE